MRDEIVKFPALAAEDVRQNLRRGEVRIVRAGEAKSDGSHSIRRIRVELYRVRFHRLKIKNRTRRKRRRGNVAKNLLHVFQRLHRLYVADNDEYGIVRHVPGVVKFSQVGISRFVERRARAQTNVFVGRAFEHGGHQLNIKNVFWIRQILRDFLLDGAAFLFPKLFIGQQIAYAGGFNAQSDVQIFDRHGEKILGDGMLGVGIVIPAQCRCDGGQLVGGQTRAATEHHVLHGVRRAGEFSWNIRPNRRDN